jgi:hypothetical protein
MGGKLERSQWGCFGAFAQAFWGKPSSRLHKGPQWLLCGAPIQPLRADEIRSVLKRGPRLNSRTPIQALGGKQVCCVFKGGCRRGGCACVQQIRWHNACRIL